MSDQDKIEKESLHTCEVLHDGIDKTFNYMLEKDKEIKRLKEEIEFLKLTVEELKGCDNCKNSDDLSWKDDSCSECYLRSNWELKNIGRR